MAPALLAAAAAAGHVSACQWLRQQGCPWDQSALDAAGRSGNYELCTWLLANGCPGNASQALHGAASGGHVTLVDQLLASHGCPAEPLPILIAAAYGCDLAAMQRYFAAWSGGPADTREQRSLNDLCVAAAAGSPTPDWRSKVEWLGTRGCGYGTMACDSAACRVDAAERLAWLLPRCGLLNQSRAAHAAAARGDLATLEYLNCFAPWSHEDLVGAAAAAGQLEAARMLHARQWPLRGGCCHEAARRGHLHVVAWMVEELGAGELFFDNLFAAAAESGSTELMAWLRERGCPWGSGAWVSAARGGSGAALEWLAAAGCPMPDGGAPYVRAAANGDLATLACLRRLGVPWAANALTGAVRQGSPAPALAWLLEAGCPVDWAAARGACGSGRPDVARVVAELEAQRAAGAVGGAGCVGGTCGEASVAPC